MVGYDSDSTRWLHCSLGSRSSARSGSTTTSWEEPSVHPGTVLAHEPMSGWNRASLTLQKKLRSYDGVLRTLYKPSQAQCPASVRSHLECFCVSPSCMCHCHYSSVSLALCFHTRFQSIHSINT